MRGYNAPISVAGGPQLNSNDFLIVTICRVQFHESNLDTI